MVDLGSSSIVAAGDMGAAFWSFDGDTGALRWSRDSLGAARDAAHGGILNAGAFDGVRFYTVNNDTGAGSATLYAMARDSGTNAFTPRTFAGDYTWAAPSLANGLLVVPVGADLHVLDASDGATLKTFQTGGSIAGGAAAIARGHIVVGSGLSYPLAADALPNDEVLCYGLP